MSFSQEILQILKKSLAKYALNNEPDISWILNCFRSIEMLHHLDFHTLERGIWQAINHVLVYCFKLNVFYILFA